VLLVACVLIAVGMAMLVYGLSIGRNRDAVAEMIRAELAERRGRDPYADKLHEPLTRRLLLPALKSIGDVMVSVAPKGVLEHYEKMLSMAGKPLGMSAEIYSGLKMMSLGVGVVAALAGLRADVAHPLARCLIALMPLAIGVILPDYFVQRRMAQRRRDFCRAFPDVVDLLVVSVEAGMSLDGALQEVVSRRDDAAAEELARVMANIRVGMPRAVAWQRLSARMPVQDVASFVAALVQAEQLGTSIGQVLRAQSDAIRARRTLLTREHAAKMPVKMLIPMVFFIFPCVFIVVLGPGGIRIFHALGNM